MDRKSRIANFIGLVFFIVVGVSCIAGILCYVLYPRNPPQQTLNLVEMEKVNRFGKRCYSSSSCLVGHLSPCNHEDNCIGNLKCIGTSSSVNSVCQCPRGTNYITEKDLISKCVADVGTVCRDWWEPKVNAFPCVDGANCISLKNDIISRCECKVGFVENVIKWEYKETFRGCDISHSYPCTGRMSCDRTAGLVCQEGFCKCPSLGNIFDAERRRCVIPVGFSCTEDNQCVTKAVCKKPEIVANEEGAYGRCFCNSSDTGDHINNLKFCDA